MSHNLTPRALSSGPLLGLGAPDTPLSCLKYLGLFLTKLPRAQDTTDRPSAALVAPWRLLGSAPASVPTQKRAYYFHTQEQQPLTHVERHAPDAVTMNMFSSQPHHTMGKGWFLRTFHQWGS